MFFAKATFAAFAWIAVCALLTEPVMAQATKYNWEVCRKGTRDCQPSRACVATLKEAQELLESGGFSDDWYLTGYESRVCSAGSTSGSSSTGSISSSSGTATASGPRKYNWEVCRIGTQDCRTSKTCVATLEEAEVLLRSGGHDDKWYLTGYRAGICSGGPVAGQKYHWEVCLIGTQDCQASRTCVATLDEAEMELLRGGHNDKWYLTGYKAGEC